MDEDNFWVSLEYRLCREFAAMRERKLQYFWCDGFVPIVYRLDAPTPTITGRCWICQGSDQQAWEFTLFMPAPCAARDHVDWASCLPAEHLTRWVRMDERRCAIELAPAAATPDP